MATFTEREWIAEFVLSESNRSLSRENVTLAAGNDLRGGAVLGRITATGKYTEYDPTAVDGSDEARAVLLQATDASLADQPVTVIDCCAEVRRTLLVWNAGLDDDDKAGGIEELTARFIKAR